MAGQMVTLTLMTTAESGVPADWATAGGAASPAHNGAARTSFQIAFRIASLHHDRPDLITRGLGSAIQHPCHAGYRFAKAPRGGAAAHDWSGSSVLEECNEEISSRDRGRRAGRRGACRATRDAGHLLRAGRKPHRARAHPQGPEPHPPHARTLLLHGHRR